MSDFPRRSIRQMRAEALSGATPAGVLAEVEELTRKQSAGGKPYFELKLKDATDGILLRVWSDTPPFATCEQLTRGDGVLVEGEFYHNAPYGVDSKRWSIRLLDDEELKDLFAGSPERVEFLEKEFDFIRELVVSIHDPRLQTLATAYLEEYGNRFLRAAAARNYHHARRGGLVEHVAQMMRAMDRVCEAYPKLNRDLCLCGVLFHDCGKLWETCAPETGFATPYEKRGELLGHITIGVELVNKLWREKISLDQWKDMQPSSEDVRLHLLHLIAAHHGEMQFGSPVVPKTPEAVALHYLDNLDAKLEMFFNGYEMGVEIAPGIYERIRPMPGNFIKPLEKIPAQGGREDSP